MNIYEFITPSDPITFKAENDKIAFACSLLLGSGKAGATRYENGKEIPIPSMLMFDPNAEKAIIDYLGCEMGDFIADFYEQIRFAFESFAYGNIESRIAYDDAIDAITDKKKLEEFKIKHEDRNRSSLSAWVKAAWNMSKSLGEKYDN